MFRYALKLYWSCHYFPAMKHSLSEVGVSSMSVAVIKFLIVRSAIVAATLVVTFAFQVHYLAAFDIDQRISLFYVPAAVITLSALTLRYRAAIGIFAGYAAINFFLHGNDPLGAVLLSMAPPTVTILTIALISMVSPRIGNFFKPNSTLVEVDAFDILLFCAGYGVINASLHNLLFFLDARFGTPVSALTVIQMMFGDLTGSFLGFVALNLSYSVLLRVIRSFGLGIRKV